MESQKIINFLEPDSGDEKYVINDQNNGQYDESSAIKK